MAEYPLDLRQRLPSSDDKTVLDRQRYRASDPLALSNCGGSQQIISFRHSPEYAVLLRQQRQLRCGSDAMEDICFGYSAVRR
jgi:hypothetical protein